MTNVKEILQQKLSDRVTLETETIMSSIFTVNESISKETQDIVDQSVDLIQSLVSDPDFIYKVKTQEATGYYDIFRIKNNKETKIDSLNADELDDWMNDSQNLKKYGQIAVKKNTGQKVYYGSTGKKWQKGSSVKESCCDDKDEKCEICEDGPTIFIDEDTKEQFYFELNEETLEERKIIIKVTSKGERIKKIKCPPGRVLKTVNDKKVCVTPTGSEKLSKKLSIKKTVRTKNAKGSGFKKRTNFKRQKALKRRRSMGL